MKYMNKSSYFTLETKGFTDIINITDMVSEQIKQLNIKDGICLISCPGSTSGITTIEYESGVISDIKKILDNIIPMSKNYEHCKKWGDCNGYAHIRSAFINPFLSVPVEDGQLILGTWQQIAFLDFDNKSRKREIKIKVIGE